METGTQGKFKILYVKWKNYEKYSISMNQIFLELYERPGGNEKVELN